MKMDAFSKKLLSLIGALQQILGGWMLGFVAISTTLISANCHCLALQQRAAGDNNKKPTSNALNQSIFAISPMIVTQSATTGRTDSISIKLDNTNGVQDIQADFKIRAFLMETDGIAYKFVEQHPHDATSWFTETPPSTFIPRGAVREIKFAFKAPASSRGLFWALLEVETHPVDPTNLIPAGPGGGLRFRVPVLLSIGRIPNAIITISDSKCTQQSVSTLVTNNSEGSSLVGLMGDLREIDTKKVFHLTSVSDLYLLPQSSRRLALNLQQKLPDGRYQAHLRVVQGGRLLPPTDFLFRIRNGEVSMLDPEEAKKPIALTSVAITADPPSNRSTSNASNFGWQMKPNDRRTCYMQLISNTNHPLSLHLEARSVKQSRDGAIGVGESDPPEGIKVLFTDSDVPLVPGGKKTIRMIVQTTKEAHGDLWFCVQARDTIDPRALPECKIFNMWVANEAPNFSPQLEVGKLEVEMQGDLPVAVNFAIANRGDQALDPDPTFEISTANKATGDSVQKSDPKQVVWKQNQGESDSRRSVKVKVSNWYGMGILPGMELDNRVLLPHLLPGDYVATITYQFGKITKSSTCNIHVKTKIGVLPAGGKPISTKPNQQKVPVTTKHK